MDLDSKQMQNKPKKIGMLGKEEAFYSMAKGGLGVVHTGLKNGKVGRILGIGGHPAIARHVAKKRNPELEITELSKSDVSVVAHSAEAVREYSALTDRMNSLI